MTILTDRTILANPANNDLVHVVDVSDTTDDPAGTSKKAEISSLGALFTATKTIQINALTDFPAPVGGLINLDAETQYVVGDDVSIGTNELVLASNTVVSGIESVVVDLNYTGTGDMFTMLNTRNRISNLSISAPNGRVINHSDNADNIFRMNDCTVDCDRFGTFNSTGTNGSSLRFTNVSPSSITTSGCTFSGDWGALLWEVSSSRLSAGDFFDLGTATFGSMVLDLILVNLSAGTNLINGLADSGNIRVGGIGSVSRILITGAGSALSGVTTDDIRWLFRSSASIKDTQEDAMVSLNNNVAETVIATQSVPVKVVGTWVVERKSLFDADTTGRVTFKGERPMTVPVDIVATINSAGGTNKDIEVFLALNGSIIANSGKTNRVSQNDPKGTIVFWQLALVKDDFLEVFIANDSDTVNLVVSDAILRVR